MTEPVPQILGAMQGEARVVDLFPIDLGRVTDVERRDAVGQLASSVVAITKRRASMSDLRVDEARTIARMPAPVFLRGGFLGVLRRRSGRTRLIRFSLGEPCSFATSDVVGPEKEEQDAKPWVRQNFPRKAKDTSGQKGGGNKRTTLSGTECWSSSLPSWY